MTLRVRWAMVLAMLAIGCGDDVPPPPARTDAGGLDAMVVDVPRPGCTTNLECDDQVSCTDDRCIAGRCIHEPQRALCPEGSACDARRGCLPRRSCRENTDCRDDDPCTSNERCDIDQRYCVFDELPAGTLCGAPGTARVCRGGACNCPDDRPLVCGSVCVDPQNDARHCGACGMSCGAGAWCSGGRCTCSVPQQWCGGVGCVDLSSDNQHCGMCGFACTPNARCESGRCVSPCPMGTHRCGDTCVNDNAVASCGTRCEVCPGSPNGTAVCLGIGAMAQCGVNCATGYHACGSRCVSDTDVNSCGTRCSPCLNPGQGTVSCTNGQCAVRCNAGYHVCGERCVSDTEVTSCGARCDTCPTPENGTAVCTNRQCDYTCPAGFRRCNGVCSDGTSTLACGPNCEPCIAPINGASQCTSGQCQFTCNFGFHRCDAQCRYNEDPESCGDRCSPCPAPAHARALCTSGACAFECDPGYLRTPNGTCEEQPRNVWPPSGTMLTGRRPRLRWRAPGATGAENETVEVCRDRACTMVLQRIAAMGETGVLSEDLPRGTSFWRVRLGDRIGPAWRVTVSGPSSMTLPTHSWGTTADFDADGFDDLGAGSPYTSQPVGRFNVFRGGTDGLRTDRRTRLEGGSNRGAYGLAVTAGDLNGDGITDLAIGAPTDLGDVGGVFIFYGRSSGFSLGPDETLRGPEGSMGYFGSSLSAAGDLNADGYADLVVGAPNTMMIGRAYVYYGGPRALSLMPNLILRSPENADARFGSSVAIVGDIDGDGDSDLAVGAENIASFTGRVFVYAGSPDGVAMMPTVSLSRMEGGRFGAAVAPAGDLDSDGFPDLVAGAPGALNGAGLLAVFTGSAQGLSNERAVVLGGTLPSGNLGSSIAGVGDVTNDGHDDLVGGAPGVDAFTGRAYFFRGGAGLAMEAPQILSSSEGPMVYFGGASGGPRDFDGDGNLDVTVGGDRARSFEGVVYVYRGGSAPLTSPSVLTSPEQGNVRFGSSLACGGAGEFRRGSGRGG